MVQQSSGVGEHCGPAASQTAASSLIHSLNDRTIGGPSVCAASTDVSRANR